MLSLTKSLIAVSVLLLSLPAASAGVYIGRASNKISFTKDMSGNLWGSQLNLGWSGEQFRVKNSDGGKIATCTLHGTGPKAPAIQSFTFDKRGDWMSLDLCGCWAGARLTCDIGGRPLDCPNPHGKC